jgi:hypothetical protein
MIKDIIPTPMDIMQMLMKFSAEMHDKFDAVNKRFDDMHVYMDRRFDLLETRVERIEKNMVHKSQLRSLLIILEKKEVIDSFEKEHVIFPVAIE